MIARIFIAVNIYACPVSAASLLARDEVNRADECISSRERETHVRLFELETQRTAREGRGGGGEEALRGRNLVKFPVKGVTPSNEGRNMPKKLFSCAMSRPNLVATKGLRQLRT